MSLEQERKRKEGQRQAGDESQTARFSTKSVAQPEKGGVVRLTLEQGQEECVYFIEKGNGCKRFRGQGCNLSIVDGVPVCIGTAPLIFRDDPEVL